MSVMALINRSIPVYWELVTLEGLFGKWRIQVDGRGLKGILGNFDL
jgi:hypothetical protein